MENIYLVMADVGEKYPIVEKAFISAFEADRCVQAMNASKENETYQFHYFVTQVKVEDGVDYRSKAAALLKISQEMLACHVLGTLGNEGVAEHYADIVQHWEGVPE